MAQKKDKKSGMISVSQTVAENRKARFEYHLQEFFQAGIVLTGTEVKSLRLGQCSLNEAFAGEHNGEIWLYGCHIPEYMQAGKHLQHTPKRPRKLLLNRREINKLIGSITREGYTLVPTKLYFDARGMAKVEIALAKGKQLHDKRAATKDRDWGRDKQRIMRDKG